MRFEFTRLVDKSKKFINAAKSVLFELLRGGKIQIKQFNAETIQLNKYTNLQNVLKKNSIHIWTKKLINVVRWNLLV